MYGCLEVAKIIGLMGDLFSHRVDVSMCDHCAKYNVLLGYSSLIKY